MKNGRQPNRAMKMPPTMRAQRRPDFRAGVDQRIRQSALMLVEMPRPGSSNNTVSHRSPIPSSSRSTSSTANPVDQAGGGRR